MKTQTILFQDNTPKVVNRRNNNSDINRMMIQTDSVLVGIHRPYRYHNPFIKDSYLSFQGVVTALSKVVYFDEIVTHEFIEYHLPLLFSSLKVNEHVDRKLAIKLFREFWNYCRKKGFVSDQEVMNLAGKKLVCFCAPKCCHGDVLVDDFILTQKRLENE